MSFNKRIDPALADFLRRQKTIAPAPAPQVGLGPGAGALATAGAPAAFAPQVIATPTQMPVQAAPQPFVAPAPSPVMAGLAQTVGLGPQSRGFSDFISPQQPSRPAAVGSPQQMIQQKRSYFAEPADPGTVTNQDMNYLLDLEAQVGGITPAGQQDGQPTNPLLQSNNEPKRSPFDFLRNEQTRISATTRRRGDDANVQQNFPNQIQQSQQRIDEIQRELDALNDAGPSYAPGDVASVYNAQTNTTIWFHRTGGQQIATAQGNHEGKPPPAGTQSVDNSERQAALAAEQAELQAQVDAWNDRLSIAQGDTYQGRPGGFVDGGFGTAMNILDAGRETIVTEYGDAIAHWIETGDENALINVLNTVAVLPSGENDFTNPNTLPGMSEGGASLGMPLTEDEARNGASAGAWMYQWIGEDESRRQGALEAYYRGYDANGDGMIDFTGGRAVWEWYIGQQPWYTSLWSQIMLDPLNLTMAAGGAAKGLRAAAGAAKINQNFKAAKILDGSATAMEFLSSIDDPIWWVQSGIIGGIARAGRATGIIRTATGDVITETDRVAATAALAMGDPAPMMELPSLTIDEVPEHRPTVINGQTVTQVGNSGSSFVGENADGTWTVYTRGADGKLVAIDNYPAENRDFAFGQARQNELVNIGILYTNPETAGQAAAYDNVIPVVFDNNAGIAYVGEGQQLRVVYNRSTGTFTVEIHAGGGRYTALPETFTSADDALNEAFSNYSGTRGSNTTWGVTPSASPNPRPSTPMTANSPFGTSGAPIGGQQPAFQPELQPTPGNAWDGEPDEELILPTRPASAVSPDSTGAGGSGAIGGPEQAPLVAPAPSAGSSDIEVGGLTFNVVTTDPSEPVQVYEVIGPNGTIYDVASIDGEGWEVWNSGRTQGPDAMQTTTGDPVRIDTPGSINSFEEAAAIINWNQATGPIGGDSVPGGAAPNATGASANVGPIVRPPDPSITPPVSPEGGPVGGDPVTGGTAPSATGPAANVGPVVTPPDPSITPPVSGETGPIGPGDAPGGGQAADTSAAADAGEVVRAGDGATEAATDAVDQATQDFTKTVDGLERGGDVPRKDVTDGDAEVNLAAVDNAPGGAAAADAAPAGAAPAGVAPGTTVQVGMYNQTITPVRGGSAVIDIPPHQAWLNNATQTAMRVTGDAWNQQVFDNWVMNNERIQASQSLFNASRRGDEIDQALSSLEAQATMMEEWAALPGALDNFGPVSPATSPGAAGMSAASSEFGPNEWAKSGRAFERIASGRPSKYDYGNMQATGYLPGREADMAHAVRNGGVPDYAASSNGRKYIVPDGQTRIYADQIANMSQAQREALASDILNPATRGKAHENQYRLDQVRERMEDAAAGRPQRGPIEAPASAGGKKPKDTTRPGADTKDKKANAKAMAPEQERLIPGERYTGWDAALRNDGRIDIEPFMGGATPQGQYLFVDEGLDESLGWKLFERNADRTARYDIVQIRTQSKAYYWSLMDENGWFWGNSFTKRDLLEKVSGIDVSTGASFLRVFDNKTGQLAVVAKGSRTPNKMAGEIADKYYTAKSVQVVRDQEGLYHLVVSEFDGKRVAVYNNYGSVAEARADALAIKRSGKAHDDLAYLDEDGSPIVATGKGEGGATYATIPGVPELAAKLQRGLGLTRTSPPKVPDPKNDGTFAGRLFDDGAIDEETYKVLNSRYDIVDKNGKVTREGVLVQDELLDRMIRTGSFDRAFNEVLDEWAAFNRPSLKGRSAGGKVWSNVNQQARANALYGMHRIIAGAAGDLIGNTYTSLINGYGVTTLKMGVRDMRTVYNAVSGGKWEGVEETIPLFEKARRNGVVIRADDVGDVSKWDVPVKGDMPASQLLQAVGVPGKVANVLTAPIQSRAARNLRNTGDAVDRLALGNVEYDRQLFNARVGMLDVVREEALRLGKDASAWHQKFVNLGDDVNLEELRKAFGNNRAINRAWKQKTIEIRDGVLKAEQKFKFVGGRTNIDEMLSDFMFFHYWNSRAIALHAEVAAKNPILINLYASAYEDGRQRAEEQNLPPWLTGWMRFMGGPEGWMGFFNAVGMAIPFFMFAEMGGEEWGDMSFRDKILSLGAFSPWVLGGLTVAGQIGRMPDLTYTTGTRNVVRATVNWMRANGYAGFDKYLSPVGDPIDSIQDDFLNWLSVNVGEAFLGGSEVEQTDPRASDLRLLNLLLDEAMTEMYGEDWREDPALVAFAMQGKAAFETGQGHTPLSEQVYKDWTSDKFKQVGIKALMPGQSQFVYGPQTANWAQMQEIYGKLDQGIPLTEDEQAALDANSANSQTADARNLNAQMDEYYDIGTKFQRDLNFVRTRLLYNDAPEGTWVVINQYENYSADEWNAMSTDDRRDAVWRWVANQGGTDQMNAYYQARDAYLEQHPELRAYVEWQNAFRQDPEVLHAEMMRRSPGYREYIEGLDDPTDQSRWMTIRAYYASIGEDYMLTDNTPSPLDPNPLNTITGYLNQPMEDEYVPSSSDSGPESDEEGYGSGNWRTMREFQQNAPAEYIAYQQEQYAEEVQAAQPIVDDVLEEGGWGWMAGMTYDEIAATAAAKGTSRAYDEALTAIRNELYRLDVKVPSKDGEIRDYERWRDNQLANNPSADVSLEAFERDKFERQERYGVGPFAPPSEIDQVESYNQEMSAWWNANPNATMYGRPADTGGTLGEYVPPPDLWWLGR